MKKPISGSFVLALLVISATAYASPAFAAIGGSTSDTSCTSQTNPFAVIGAIWGVSGSPQSVYPGDQNVPLTITVLFSGPCTAPQASIELSLASSSNPVPFTGQDGVTQPKNIALNVSPNTLFTETFYMNVEQSATTGITYYIPVVIQYDNNSVSSVITELATAPIALYGPVQLNFAAGSSHLSAGGVDNLTLTISNSGSASSGPVSTTVSAPSSVTLLNQLPMTTGLAPGGSATEVLQLFVPSSLSGTAITMSLTAKYLDAYSNTQTVTQTLGFMVSSPTVEPASSFVVEGSQWGSAGSTTSPLPGTQDTPLVVSMQYLGSTPVTSFQGTVQLPAGITDLNGRSTAVAFSSATTNQYGAIQLTFYVNLASSLMPGSYNFTLNLEWSTSQSVGLTQTAVLTPPPIPALQSQFLVEGATWGTSSTATAPLPGTQNSPLVVTLQYLGTTSVTSLKGTVTMPAGITDLNGHPTATAFAAIVSANQVISLTFNLDVASSVKPGSYNFSLGLSWITSVSVTLTQSASFSPPPIAAPATTASFPLAVVQVNSTLAAGSQNPAGFQLTNQGTASIYSPTFSLNVGSPIVVASTGSSVPAPQLDPGKATTFDVVLTSGPSAAIGVYSGTLTVTFTDSNGASHTQTFPLSFTLKGTVILILQNTLVSQTTTGFTVTGSILNEGTVPAYYASLTGLFGPNVGTAVYIGEVDPNTPAPFSVTIPYIAATASTTTTTSTTSAASSLNGTGFSTTASSSTSSTFISVSTSRTLTGSFSRNSSFVPGGAGTFGVGRTSTGANASASIVLTLNYKDGFSANQVFAFTVPTTVKTASQLVGAGGTVTTTKTTTSVDYTTYVAYGAVAAVAVTIVVGGFLMRRYRSKRFANMPQQDIEEKSVI